MLTGKTRHRLGWRKKFILQVECWVTVYSLGIPRAIPGKEYVRQWRDATFRDVIDIEQKKYCAERPKFSRIPPPPPPRQRDVTERAAAPAHEPDLVDVGCIDYRFLGATGEEDA